MDTSLPVESPSVLPASPGIYEVKERGYVGNLATCSEMYNYENLTDTSFQTQW